MRRLLFVGVVLPSLIFWFVPASTMSWGLGFTPWGYALPEGELLRKALRSCQFTRYGSREYTLCPQRLAYRSFPKHLASALIASEDRAFFQHRGIDKRAILQAALANFGRSVRTRSVVVRRGGSTITQQFARTLFLDERDGFGRKLEELALAPRIEAVLTKQEILAGYMNVVPHARGLNGFDAAARHFFGMPVGSIDLAEAALLVGMLPAPNDRDPIRRPEPAYTAAVRVLDRMADMQMITDTQVRRAEWELRTRVLGRRLKRGRYAGVDEETRPYRDLAMAEARRYGALGGDYRVVTHMNPDLQDRIVDAARQIAGRHQAAGVFIRPTGEVLGIAGSRNYVESSLNRAVQSRQPIGSTGNMFVLVAAYENGLDPRRLFSQGPLPDDRSNRRCRQDMTLAQALAASCNRPFARAAVELAGKLTTVVDRFQIRPREWGEPGPLGMIQTSPLLLARSYAAVANDGGLPTVRSVVAVFGRAGGIRYLPATDTRRVMSSETAKAVLETLREPMLRRAAARRAPVYGTVGTTAEDRDALFVGMTKDYVGAFWVGDDSDRSFAELGGSDGPERAFARVTEGYYQSGRHRDLAYDQAYVDERYWRLPLDILQNREHRYYAFAAFAALVMMTFWLQLRHSAIGWAVRTKFGMRPLAGKLLTPWRWFRNVRLLRWGRRRR